MKSMIKTYFSSFYHGLKDWSTKRKIIVIESDDWGSMRMPSSNIFNSLEKNGINVSRCPFLKYDTIANVNDLNALFETLISLKDNQGRSLQITANTIVANPNFEAIFKSNYNKYFFEDFLDTIEHQYPGKNVFQLWKQGIGEKIFFPQLHGREHVNYHRWLSDLKNGVEDTVIAFKHKVYGLSTNISLYKRKTYLASFDFDNEEHTEEMSELILNAVELFQNAFNYLPKSFIAPNYVWCNKLEKSLAKNDIKFIQSSRFQLLPYYMTCSKTNKVKHFLGEKNKNNQIYLVRNCIFEPTIVGGAISLKSCLNQVSAAFMMNKPAIISSHRLNYIGELDIKNRERNLVMLKQLFKTIIEKYPDFFFFPK